MIEVHNVNATAVATAPLVGGVGWPPATDITVPPSVAVAATGADVVVCAISACGVDRTLLDVADSLVDGVRQAGVNRLLLVASVGSLEGAPGQRPVDSLDFLPNSRPRRCGESTRWSSSLASPTWPAPT